MILKLTDLKSESGLHKIPRDIYVNQGILLDSDLFDTFMGKNNDPTEYDFDVFLPKYGINLQRDYVWTHTQQDEFIKSLILEKPIDPVIVVRVSKSKGKDIIYKVIDGKQRLMTIKKFFK